MLWECTAYSSSRASFTEKLQELLGDSYADFDLLSNAEKTSYVLGSEHWEKNFKSLLFLVKEYIVDVWEVRKQIMYGDDACPSHLQSQSSVGDLGGVTGVDGHRSLVPASLTPCKYFLNSTLFPNFLYIVNFVSYQSIIKMSRLQL